MIEVPCDAGGSTATAVALREGEESDQHREDGLGAPAHTVLWRGLTRPSAELMMSRGGTCSKNSKSFSAVTLLSRRSRIALARRPAVFAGPQNLGFGACGVPTLKAIGLHRRTSSSPPICQRPARSFVQAVASRCLQAGEPPVAAADRISWQRRRSTLLRARWRRRLSWRARE